MTFACDKLVATFQVAGEVGTGGSGCIRSGEVV